MRLLLIRHGDPDYEHDSLTEKGKREADLLAAKLTGEKIDHFYVSPLGRARRSAAPTLAQLGRDAAVMDWLREFPDVLNVGGSPFLQKAYPDTRRREDGSFENRILWDLLPSVWMRDPRYFDPELWRETEPVTASGGAAVYDEVCASFDTLLEQHGYRREGRGYVTQQGTNDTVACFCHFGVTCVMLSHLWTISPFLLWGSLVMAPSSVTELYTEEREKGIVCFRASKIGDISHLYAGGEEPSFAARFCSVYENAERH